ncbi:6-hydroxynicotinate 3-monooxygenase precursor [Micromonospora sp. MW-13]|uniref:FAD-dependent monooxygenase n=1 Tax=Micromonospora sp. MW-13 TaxID=2094022 RepID=UPI000E437C19|nr:FAD-dependent monooxygenase [Micromonospora sp. MW-13]RGC65401.1 6-hydroxynicotinate 3-monooxygenase precursor [Micromonospora sp. MW-13]
MPTAPLAALRVLISGAGVAGPALALRLAEQGARVTVVEIAPRLRGSGFAVDFRGPTHTAVLQRLGVLDDLRARQTHGSAMTCVDEHGREIFTLPAEFTGGELEVARRDLSRLLHDRGADRVEYLFGDTITGLHDTGTDVQVEFRDSDTRVFDLAIGADGMHSTVRRLTFGDEHRFLRPLGYHIAGWDLPNTFGFHGSSRYFNVPGRMASIGPDPRDSVRATAMVVFRSTDSAVDWHDQDAQKKLITHTFADLPWHVPALLDTLTDAPDLYFDAIAKINAPDWTRGRIALLGDAAWGVTLGGMGVGTGLVGAHVLAGELANAEADHRAAFTAYEQRMRAYAGRWQKGANPGKFLAPATRRGLALRNRLMAASVVQRMLLSGTKSLATDTDLPDYP